MNFVNQICPVCEKKFTEEDEVVVCPECGTPHHRECYFSFGECKNKALHKENFIYKKNEEVSTEKLDVLIEDDVKKTSDVLDVINIEYDENAPKDKENIQKTIEDLFKNINGKSTDKVLIDKIPSSYYEAAIGKNQNYYMPRFLILESTQKKFLLNVFAFIFPLAWAVYRKMYKLALLVFALYIGLFSVTLAPVLMNDELVKSMEACVNEDPNFAEKLLLYNSGKNVTFTKTQAEFIELSENFKTPSVVVYGTFIVSMAMKIYIGLGGTSLYMKKLKKSIEKVISLPVEEEKKRVILKSKCGVTPMFVAVIVGIIEYIIFGRF